MTSSCLHIAIGCVWIFSLITIHGFTLTSPPMIPRHPLVHTRISFSVASTKKDASDEPFTSGKGFGKNVAPKTRSKTPPEDDSLTTASSTTTDYISPSSTKPSSGQDALTRMRQVDTQRRNEELKSMQQLQQLDQSLKEDPSLAVIPEKVAARMGRRMLPFVGVPLFGSMLTFVLFWYLATYKDFSIPTVVVAYATSAILIIGLMGITYSVMSASWDEDREGSAMGWEEFQKNINNVKDGLKRSRENAVLRDKLNTLSDEEKMKMGGG